MIRHAFTYNGKKYDIRGKDCVDFAYKVINAISKKNVPSVTEWYYSFLELYKPSVTRRTKESYIQRFEKHISPYIGNMKIDEVVHSDCQKILSNMNGYSKNTIKKIYDDMNQLFEKAVVNEYITTSPLLNVSIPNGHQTNRRSLTNEEILVTIQTVEKYNIGLPYIAMMCCGLRPHELSLIQGKDIQGNRLHIRGIKTKQSDRYVPIPDLLLNNLKEYNEEEYVFKSLEGLSPMTESHRRKYWLRFVETMQKENKVADDLVPYCYRHTYSTLLQEGGVSLNVIREFMGHSNLSTTQNYLHNTCQFIEQESNLVNSIFNGSLSPTLCQTENEYSHGQVVKTT